MIEGIWSLLIFPKKKRNAQLIERNSKKGKVDKIITANISNIPVDPC